MLPMVTSKKTIGFLGLGGRTCHSTPELPFPPNEEAIEIEREPSRANSLPSCNATLVVVLRYIHHFQLHYFNDNRSGPVRSGPSSRLRIEPIPSNRIWILITLIFYRSVLRTGSAIELESWNWGVGWTQVDHSQVEPLRIGLNQIEPHFNSFELPIEPDWTVQNNFLVVYLIFPMTNKQIKNIKFWGKLNRVNQLNHNLKVSLVRSLTRSWKHCFLQ